MGTGPLIAIDVMLLYIIFGPVVLFAIYVLFDAIDSAGKAPTGEAKKEASAEKDPALWASEEIDAGCFIEMDFGRNKNRI